MLKVLDVEGAVQRSGSRWALAPGAATWTYDAERYREVTALRRAEQEAMARYGGDGRCLMRVLQERARRPASHARCGRCSVCAGPRWADASLVDPAVVAEAQRHLRGAAVELGVKKQWPATADRKQQRIPEELRLWGARALARPGDGGWDELLRAALERRRGGRGGARRRGSRALGAFAPGVGDVGAVARRRRARRCCGGSRTRWRAGSACPPRRSCGARPTARRCAGCATRPRSSTTCAALRGRRRRAARTGAAARRRVRLGLDARDGGRPAAPPRRGGGARLQPAAPGRLRGAPVRAAGVVGAVVGSAAERLARAVAGGLLLEGQADRVLDVAVRAAGRDGERVVRAGAHRAVRRRAQPAVLHRDQERVAVARGLAVGAAGRADRAAVACRRGCRRLGSGRRSGAGAGARCGRPPRRRACSRAGRQSTKA